MAAGFRSVRGQRGAGRVKLFLTLFVIVTLVILGMRILPVYITDQEMQHEIKEIARQAAVRRKTEKDIRRDLISRHQDYWITLPDNLEYSVSRRDKMVVIEVDTTVPINLLFTTYDYRINFKATDSGLGL